MVARSYRHTPITGITTAESEKDDKRRANRALRRSTRQMIQARGVDVDRDELPRLREVSNVYDFAGDGSRYWHDVGRLADPPHWFKQIMRK